MFASVGATLFISDTPTAEAKSYKSGKKVSQTTIITTTQISKNLRIKLKTKIMQQQIKIIQLLQTKRIQQLRKVGSSQAAL